MSAQSSSLVKHAECTFRSRFNEVFIQKLDKSEPKRAANQRAREGHSLGDLRCIVLICEPSETRQREVEEADRTTEERRGEEDMPHWHATASPPTSRVTCQPPYAGAESQTSPSVAHVLKPLRKCVNSGYMFRSCVYCSRPFASFRITRYCK